MGLCYIKPSNVDTTLIMSLESLTKLQSPNDSIQDSNKTNDSSNEVSTAIRPLSAQEELPSWLQEKNNTQRKSKKY